MEVGVQQCSYRSLVVSRACKVQSVSLHYGDGGCGREEIFRDTARVGRALWVWEFEVGVWTPSLGAVLFLTSLYKERKRWKSAFRAGLFIRGWKRLPPLISTKGNPHHLHVQLLPTLHGTLPHQAGRPGESPSLLVQTHLSGAHWGVHKRPARPRPQHTFSPDTPSPFPERSSLDTVECSSPSALRRS